MICILLLLFKTQSKQICDPPAAKHLFRRTKYFFFGLYLYLPTTMSLFLISLIYSVSSSYAHSTLWLHWETSMFHVLSMGTRALVTMAFSCWKADYSQGRSVCLEFFIPDEQHSPLWPWNHRNLLLPLSLTHAQTGIRHVYWPFKKKIKK